MAGNQTTVTVSRLCVGVGSSRSATPIHFWQIVLAILIWPYYVGDAVATG